MIFIVFENGDETKFIEGRSYLKRDRWDDYHYNTAFNLFYCKENGSLTPIGWVKVAYKNMGRGTVLDKIPKKFTSLDDEYFSLGQSVDYYDNLRLLGDEIRETVLIALKDVALDPSLLRENLNEDAMRYSLLRGVSPSSVNEQFHRVACGGVPLTEYNFTYSVSQNNYKSESVELLFSVTPSSTPPTNIHAIIGTNGAGKTTLIKDVLSTVYNLDRAQGSFSYNSKDANSGKFANVVAVSFSPFDSFAEINQLIQKTDADFRIPYTFVGLDKSSEDLSTSITNQFIKSLSLCKANPHKKELWSDSIELLKSDPVFAELEIDALTREEAETISAEDLFSSLSSGHKVVLLTITCCVAHIAEKSLVVIDEPEHHLHPPLLSALIRSLSRLLIDRNGVAIISTHSPVVLQEVPSDCVWKIRRLGNHQIAERPMIQTFGANAGTLISEVFGLEVTKSGFHQMIEEAVDQAEDFDDIVSSFGHQLGDEALILARALLANKRQGDSDE